MTMDRTEQFVLRERDGERKHRTMRIGLFLTTAVLVSLVFSARSCALGSKEVESEKVRQAGKTERLKLADYTRCLKRSPRTECDRAYYPFREDPLTPEQQRALEGARAEHANQFYVHCTTKTDVDDAYCDDETDKIMQTVKASQ